jgi:predicted dehydrogenase
LRYLIVGLGSIGKRHLGNIKLLDPEAIITVWHTHSKRRDRETSDPYSEREVFSIEEAIDPKPDAAFITNPSPAHIPIALRLAQEGIDLFIEKPLSSDLSGVDDLLRIQKNLNILIMIGYNLRFHMPLQIMKQCIDDGKLGKIIGIRAEVGQYLPEWRPGTDYRSSVSARRELGGGAVLELSHELDYVPWLAGEVTSVIAQTDHISDLDINVEDTADIILKFSGGAQGSIHLDMIQQPSTRSCKVVGTEGTITWDGTSGSVMLFLNKTRQWSTLHKDQNADRNQMYLSEIEHFFTCIRDRKEPLINGFDGKRVLQLALAILQSSREMRRIIL